MLLAAPALLCWAGEMPGCHLLASNVQRVLAARGVTQDNVGRFLDPTIRELLPNPQSLTDMEKAAARIADAVERRERVAIFGDYDVDGAASSALMQRLRNQQPRRD